MSKKPIPFDKFEIKVFADGYALTVGKMRPRNAPRWRRTSADFKRQRYVAEENMRLAEEGLKQPMQTIDEVMARIKSYGGII